MWWPVLSEKKKLPLSSIHPSIHLGGSSIYTGADSGVERRGVRQGAEQQQTAGPGWTEKGIIHVSGISG